MYSRSLFRLRCLSLPIWTVAYVATGEIVQGGKLNFAYTAKGAKATVEKDLVVKEVSSP
jgi:hypothetical protein